MSRYAILDGYVDEPACLGVPPYISPYPRYIAGAIWQYDPHAEVVYQTIDQVRVSFDAARAFWATCDMVILIAGMIVPGKYLGGTPISFSEANLLFSGDHLSNTVKILVGPWARFGCGIEGGKMARRPEELAPPFDFVISGDAETVLFHALSGGFHATDLDMRREKSEKIEQFARKGTRIVMQHPEHSSGYMICEIETYRGCSRYVTGGCSFCIEPSYGHPNQRDAKSIVAEVELLYQYGIRAIRIGGQADLFVYGSKELGEVEFPVPFPTAIAQLFSGIRRSAPDLLTFHIDNVNPGTVVHHRDESEQVAKTIMKYHTTGDVAAFGVESTDPEVIRRNNLKVDSEEALEAIRILNRIGNVRPHRELPHLLPGINLLYGLEGETERTLEYNMTFLQTLLEEGLLVRRINIRQVIDFPRISTTSGKSPISHSAFIKHKNEVREKIDLKILRAVAPSGTIIRNVFLEARAGNNYLLRPLASYPLLCHMAHGAEPPRISDVFVVDHGPRSVTVLPYPLNPHYTSFSQWQKIPGIGSKRAGRIKTADHLNSITDLEERLGIELPPWLKESIVFNH